MEFEERVRELLQAYRLAVRDLSCEHAKNWSNLMKTFEADFDEEYGIEDHDTSWLV